MNPFDLLGDDAEDPSQQIVAEQLKAQLPTKPLPPSQAGLFSSLQFAFFL